MDPQQILAKLMPLLMSMLGQSGQYGPGGFFPASAAQSLFNTILPGMPGIGNVAGELMRHAQMSMFATQPFAMYGGPGTQWNISSRMMEWQRMREGYAFELSTGSAVSQVISDQTRGASDTAKAFAQGGAMAIGAYDIGSQMFKARGALGGWLGATPGSAAFARTSQISANLSGLRDEVTRDFMTRGMDYGNLMGRDVGDLFRVGAITGEFGGLQGMGKGALSPQQKTSLTSNIRETARSLSGIRDIIQGDIPQVVDQLQAIFGQGAAGVGGIRQAAAGLQRMRMMAETTGTRLSDMVQFAQGAGVLGVQLTGSSINAVSGGGTIAAMMGVSPQGVPGLDPASYARNMTTRVSGAQMSDVAMMINAGLAFTTRDRGQVGREIAAAGGVLTADRIAEIAGVSVETVRWGRFSRAAQDQMARDNTATYAVMEQNRRQAVSLRASAMDRVLGGGARQDLDALARDRYGMSVAELAPRDMERILREGGVSGASIGQLGLYFDRVAQSFGWSNAEEQMTAYSSQRRAQELEREAGRKEALASKYGLIGGGIAGMIKSVGLGRMTTTGLGDMFRDWANMLPTGKGREAMAAFLGVGQGADVGRKMAETVYDLKGGDIETLRGIPGIKQGDSPAAIISQIQNMSKTQIDDLNLNEKQAAVVKSIRESPTAGRRARALDALMSNLALGRNWEGELLSSEKMGKYVGEVQSGVAIKKALEASANTAEGRMEREAGKEFESMTKRERRDAFGKMLAGADAEVLRERFEITGDKLKAINKDGVSSEEAKQLTETIDAKISDFRKLTTKEKERNYKGKEKELKEMEAFSSTWDQAKKSMESDPLEALVDLVGDILTAIRDLGGGKADS